MQSPVMRAHARAYYVSIRNETGQTIMALGPFSSHRRALGLVDCVRHAIRRADLDTWAAFGYGTCSVPMSGTLAAGAFNGALNVGPSPMRARIVPARINPAIVARVADHA